MQDQAGGPGMPGADSAVIVPFPRRPGTSPSSQTQPDAELSRSLQRLEQALAEQREAIAAWRSANAALAASVIALGGAFARLEAGLATVVSRSPEPSTASTNP